MSMHEHNQRGVVSILSVIFFILLMSVLTISFLRIMTDEQDQVIDDDLSKSALASAESGVEDAKRGLVHCRSLTGVQRTQCYQALNNQNCPGMFAATPGNPLVGPLGLDQLPDGSIRVGNASNNQRYTCVVTSLQTRDVVGQASDSLGQLLPLRAASTYNRVTVYWHQPNIDGNLAVPGVTDTNNNYRYSDWHDATNNRFIPVLRLQLIAFDRTQTLTQMENSSSGMFLHPMSNGTYSLTTQLTITDPVRPGSIGDKRVEVRCNTASLQSGFACAMSMNVPPVSPGGNKQYYLMVRSVYGTPHYKVELGNSATNNVLFDDVQPEIDSTGAAGDIFRRIKSRVSYAADTFMTSNSVESGVSLCKDFFVTDTNATSPGGCLTGLLTP